MPKIDKIHQGWKGVKHDKKREMEITCEECWNKEYDEREVAK